LAIELLINHGYLSPTSFRAACHAAIHQWTTQAGARLSVVGSGWVKPFPLPWPGSSPHARAGLVDSPAHPLAARKTVHIRVGSKTASFFRKNRSLFTEIAQPVVELIY
tara:strand:+ start:122 stop:445 length:324 start_codon:yes stop_codon:yes gene_type:complete